MATPMPADVLEVYHHDGRVTYYDNVTYWPWRDGVSVWHHDGSQVDHPDVLAVHADRLAAQRR